MTGESYLELLSQWLIPEPDNVGLLKQCNFCNKTGHQRIMLLTDFHCGLDNMDCSSHLPEVLT
jgi:hypothetical protein